MLSKDQQELVVDNLNWAKWLAWRWQAKTGWDYDECESLAYLGLVKAARHYDPSRSKITTYVERCVANEFKMEYRRRNKRAKETLFIDLSTIPENPEGTGIPEEYLAKHAVDPTLNQDGNYERVENMEMVCQMLSLLSDRDLQIVLESELKISTQVELGKRYGLSQSYISRLVKKRLGELHRWYERVS